MTKQRENSLENLFLYKFIRKNATSFNVKFLIAFVTFTLFFKLLMAISHIEIKSETSNHVRDTKKYTPAPKKANFNDILGNGRKVRDHDQVYQFIHKWFLDPPSQLPYHLHEDKQNDAYNSYKWLSPSYRFLNSVIKDFFKTRSHGFFVEAGALDGEHLSNTLQLERELYWTGLLVEGDRTSYSMLRRKHRKSWSSSLCLATKPYPHEVVFTAFEKKSDLSWSGKGAARIQQNVSIYSLDGPGYASFAKVLCIPAGDIIMALNVTHVDFFSLDVEGVEMDVLKNFPFDKITVDLWAIEHTNINDPGPGSNPEEFYISKDHNYRYEDPNLVSFMESKGYYFFDMFCQVIPDYVFVRKESYLYAELAVPKNMEKRKNLCIEKQHYDPAKMAADPEYLRDKRHWPSLKFTP